jgi:hypothetical protein
MNYRNWALIALPAALLAGCATTSTPVASTTPASAPVVAAAVDNSKSCISLRSIRESRVRSDSIIDFIMNDGKTYRNTLPFSCPALGFERAYSYETSLSQLCSVDIITVITQGAGPARGASCGLGKFVPYTPVPASGG